MKKCPAPDRYLTVEIPEVNLRSPKQGYQRLNRQDKGPLFYKKHNRFNYEKDSEQVNKIQNMCSSLGEHFPTERKKLTERISFRDKHGHTA